MDNFDRGADSSSDSGSEDVVMRSTASIMHLDLDAFFASVEQRDKPSLRGKPVIVGGVGPRGVVATASYEARQFGVRSAMRTSEARARCPHAAFLSGRFEAYRESSEIVMGVLRNASPLVEPLSFDEAFVDLAAAQPFTPDDVSGVAHELLKEITRATAGLTASAGVASSKLMAKIASELNKPDGVFVVSPGTEIATLGPMQVTVIPGVGPATGERLRVAGVHTVDELRVLSENELTRLLGRSSGSSLYRLARAEDRRSVNAERESKSVSAEDTFVHDIADRLQLTLVVDRLTQKVASRLTEHQLSGRTITLKFRYHDFETHTRSSTLAGPSDSVRVLCRVAQSLLADIDVSRGVRLLGVGVSGLADWVQDDLFGDVNDPDNDDDDDDGHKLPAIAVSDRSEWRPGMDVVHRRHGRGWVWGSGLDRVTVRFETRDTPPGPIHTLWADDPDLEPCPPGTVKV